MKKTTQKSKKIEITDFLKVDFVVNALKGITITDEFMKKANGQLGYIKRIFKSPGKFQEFCLLSGNEKGDYLRKWAEKMIADKLEKAKAKLDKGEVLMIRDREISLSERENLDRLNFVNNHCYGVKGFFSNTLGFKDSAVDQIPNENTWLKGNVSTTNDNLSVDIEDVYELYKHADLQLSLFIDLILLYGVNNKDVVNLKMEDLNEFNDMFKKINKRRGKTGYKGGTWLAIVPNPLVAKLDSYASANNRKPYETIFGITDTTTVTKKFHNTQQKYGLKHFGPQEMRNLNATLIKKAFSTAKSYLDYVSINSSNPEIRLQTIDEVNPLLKAWTQHAQESLLNKAYIREKCEEMTRAFPFIVEMGLYIESPAEYKAKIQDMKKKSDEKISRLEQSQKTQQEAFNKTMENFTNMMGALLERSGIEFQPRRNLNGTSGQERLELINENIMDMLVQIKVSNRLEEQSNQ